MFAGRVQFCRLLPKQSRNSNLCNKKLLINMKSNLDKAFIGHYILSESYKGKKICHSIDAILENV